MKGKVSKSAAERDCLLISEEHKCMGRSKSQKWFRALRVAHHVMYAVVFIAVVSYVCVRWWSQGCGVWSLVACVAFYAAICFGTWYVSDTTFFRGE